MPEKGELENPIVRDTSITRVYGKTLKTRRTEAKLSQQEAAEQIGVSQKTISRFESGEAQPDYATFRKMSDVYGCKMSELAPRNQYPSAPLDPVERLAYMNLRNRNIREGAFVYEKGVYRKAS